MSNIDWASRVQRGIAYLDLRGPEGWRDKVNLEILDLTNGELCVIGQIFGSYWKFPDLRRDDIAAEDYGFFWNDQDDLVHIQACNEWLHSKGPWYDQPKWDVHLRAEWIRALSE